MASQPGLIPVANETNASSSRITRDGRRITYRMTVMQQPERARACGSGAKSSNDRRPVDPPPIIQLKVFEGPNCEKDITFQYNANFFLYATLENARNIAHGRVAQSSASLPVLTGTPVAGVAMLDRPEKAGYFIFPDLSVRHEGKYRLGFSLYEELKDAKDLDSETAENIGKLTNPHVSHRLEVKSREFNVYSAKKFPGLSNSTDLSRCFAEQGCRVRIRREVRMRRRDTKRDFDEEEYDHYERSRVSATPDTYVPQQVATPHAVESMDRPRSSSNASNYGQHSRRASMEQMHQQYQQPYASPQANQPMYAGHQHGQWQNPPPSNSYMPPPPQSYPSQQNYPAPQPPAMAPPSYGYGQQQQYSHYDQSHARHSSVEYPQPPSGPPRTTSTPQPQMPAPPAQQYQGHPPPYSTNGHYPAPANLQASPVQPNFHSASQPPMSQSAYPAPPVNKPESLPVAQSQQYYDANHGTVTQPPAVAGTKRAYGSSFDTQALDAPLRHGARPTVSGADPKYSYLEASNGEDDGLDVPADMEYRRADGSARRRRLPLLG